MFLVWPTLSERPGVGTEMIGSRQRRGARHDDGQAHAGGSGSRRRDPYHGVHPYVAAFSDEVGLSTHGHEGSQALSNH
jgi:hypothetical protein